MGSQTPPISALTEVSGSPDAELSVARQAEGPKHATSSSDATLPSTAATTAGAVPLAADARAAVAGYIVAATSSSAVDHRAFRRPAEPTFTLSPSARRTTTKR